MNTKLYRATLKTAKQAKSAYLQIFVEYVRKYSSLLFSTNVKSPCKVERLYLN